MIPDERNEFNSPGCWHELRFTIVNVCTSWTVQWVQQFTCWYF